MGYIIAEIVRGRERSLMVMAYHSAFLETAMPLPEPTIDRSGHFGNYCMILRRLMLVLGVAMIYSESQWEAYTRKTACAVLGDRLAVIDLQAYCYSWNLDRL